ncbi:flagellar export chaperone FliS [Phycicoccus sp. Root101]|uniref:flagellar export chaperone FliS n=1 Tax=Phycicoccus sp. Root101 TaxID=1736421 RepID=UPI000B145CA8|nr:flagellar export chaperone FliS [Phycicoccus sp. Root101]
MTTSAMLRRRYHGDAVTTASPNRLVVMLYDRLLKDLNTAFTAVAAGDIEVAHRNLLHAQDIVAELSGSLDLDLWPEGTQLKALYDYLTDRLVRANVTKDATFVTECLEVVEPLRDAFAEAALAPDPA